MQPIIRQSKFSQPKSNQSKFRHFNSSQRYLLAGSIAILAVLGGVPTYISQTLNGGHPDWVGGDRALASTSGGRARGGSFDEPAPEPIPDYSDGGYSGDGYDGGYGDGYGDGYGGYPDGGYFDQGGYPYEPSWPAPPSSSFPRAYPPAYVPAPYPAPYSGPVGYSGGSAGSVVMIIIFMLMMFIVPTLLRSVASANRGRATSVSAYGERDNSIITVTRLQIAMLAQARHVQEQLTQLTLNADMQSRPGLSAALQEAALVVLRSPEHWTHVRANSQTVETRQDATRLFEQLSLEERSKLSSEVLVNIGGRVRRSELRNPPDDAPASYIVVTFLVGTADDRPLLSPIHSASELTTALQRLGATSPDYLMVFELLWSPQDPSDSLTYDELLAGYPDLIQIA